MGQSISSRYAAAVEQSFVSPTAWTWPRTRKPGEASPDARLLNRNIAGARAEIVLRNGATVETRVKSVSTHDLVLAVDDLATLPVMGQVVEVLVRQDGATVVQATRAIAHWSGRMYGQAVVALFTIESMGEAVEQWFDTHARGDVRFALDLPGVIYVNKDKDVFGRLVDYSLSGCRFLAEENIELETNYPFTVLMPNASVEMSLRPRWVLHTKNGYQMGCTFEPEQGVLLACRHHPVPTGLTSPLRPQTNNWTGAQDDRSF